LDAPAFYAYVLAIAPNGKTIYLSGDDETPGNQVSTFSIQTQEQSGIGGVGDTDYIPALAITSDSNTLYACCAGGFTNEIVPITNLLSSPTVQPGILLTYPYGAVFNSDNTLAYAISFAGADNFSTINVPTSTVTSTLTVGANPQFLAITGDGSYVYTTNASPSVSVVNTKTNAVTSFNLDPIANGIAIATTPPPSNVVGTLKKNVFLDKTERILHITWASSSDTVTSYNIYNGVILVASVPSTSPLSYNALLPNGDSGTHFSVTAVSPVGGESLPAPVNIQS
jgi:DNA-binding beta-propeller fold protein YncE